MWFPYLVHNQPYQVVSRNHTADPSVCAVPAPQLSPCVTYHNNCWSFSVIVPHAHQIWLLVHTTLIHHLILRAQVIIWSFQESWHYLLIVHESFLQPGSIPSGAELSKVEIRVIPVGKGASNNRVSSEQSIIKPALHFVPNVPSFSTLHHEKQNYLFFKSG